jgi:hypothetical protein
MLLTMFFGVLQQLLFLMTLASLMLVVSLLSLACVLLAQMLRKNASISTITGLESLLFEHLYCSYSVLAILAVTSISTVAIAVS